jgi:carboxypeptidase family protein
VRTKSLRSYVSRVGGMVLPAVLAVSVARPAAAQTTTSILEGRVLDPSGAGVAATVEVKGPTLRRSVTADPSGFYRAVALPAGVYSVSASSCGFKTKVLEGIELFLLVPLPGRELQLGVRLKF